MPVLTMRFDARDDEGKSVQAPAVFARFGPIFQVVLVPHEEMKGASPKQGYAMIDTGASGTCVDTETAKSAGWPIIDTANMSSTTHSNQVMPVFAGRLFCAAFNNHIEAPRWMGVNLDSAGSPFPLVALIGRDLLQNAVFIYNGHDLSFTWAI